MARNQGYGDYFESIQVDCTPKYRWWDKIITLIMFYSHDKINTWEAGASHALPKPLGSEWRGMSCTDLLWNQFLFLTKTGHWQSPWCCLSTQKMWQISWLGLAVHKNSIFGHKSAMLTMHLFKSKRKISNFWKSFYPPCSDSIFWWSSCRFRAVELFGEAGPGSNSKVSWKWEPLPSCGVFWCKQQGKTKFVFIHVIPG